MEFTAKTISEFVHGRIEGDENATVNSFANIEEGHKGALSFLANPKYIHLIHSTEASIVLVDEDITLPQPVKTTIIRVKNAYESIAHLLQLYQSMQPKKVGCDPLAFISPTATIGNDCYIGAFAYIADGAEIGDNTVIHPHAIVGENVKIGNDCLLYPHVVVYHDCVIGNRVILHAGSIIGADGFGFTPNENGYEKIPQIGIVTIEDDVEIGANSCVDRATMGSTYIRKGVKLDNLVQIAHNTDIGQHTVMSAQTGVAGSTKVGEWCVFAGQVGITGHVTIGDHVTLGAQSGAAGSIKSNKTLIGTPPMPHITYFKAHILSQQLPEMNRQIKDLQRQIDELKKLATPATEIDK